MIMSQRASYEEVSAISSELLYKSGDLEKNLTWNAEDRTYSPSCGYSSKQARDKAWDWYRKELADALAPLGWTIEELDAADERATEEFYASLKPGPVPEHEIIHMADIDEV